MSSTAELLQTTADSSVQTLRLEESSAAADRETRRQAAVVAIGRRAVDPTDIDRLVQDAAALVAETLDAVRYGVAELSDDGQKLRLRIGNIGGQAGSVADPDLENQAPLDQATSLAGYALHTAQPLVVPDLTKEERTQDRFLRDHGVRGALVVPLQLKDQSYGALAAYSDSPREFARGDILFAEAVAHLVSTTIGRDRTMKTLKEEQKFTRTVLETVGALVIVFHPDGRIRRINRACQRVTGFTPDEVAEAAIWKTLLVSDEVPEIRATLDKVCGSNQPLDHECHILTKQGERRRIQWSFAVMSQAAGSVDSIIATGIDITEQHESKTEVGRLQAAAMESNRQLETLMSRLNEQVAAAPAPQQNAARSAAPFQSALAKSHADQRRHPRRAFSYIQRIAPMTDELLPHPKSFREVQCHDISAGGFSFLLPSPPDHTSFVVALGTPPALIYMSARVTHAKPMEVDGRPMFLVGCAYAGRIEY